MSLFFLRVSIQAYVAHIISLLARVLQIFALSLSLSLFLYLTTDVRTSLCVCMLPFVFSFVHFIENQCHEAQRSNEIKTDATLLALKIPSEWSIQTSEKLAGHFVLIGRRRFFAIKKKPADVISHQRGRRRLVRRRKQRKALSTSCRLILDQKSRRELFVDFRTSSLERTHHPISVSPSHLLVSSNCLVEEYHWRSDVLITSMHNTSEERRNTDDFFSFDCWCLSSFLFIRDDTLKWTRATKTKKTIDKNQPIAFLRREIILLIINRLSLELYHGHDPFVEQQ